MISHIGTALDNISTEKREEKSNTFCVFLEEGDIKRLGKASLFFGRKVSDVLFNINDLERKCELELKVESTSQRWGVQKVNLDWTGDTKIITYAQIKISEGDYHELIRDGKIENIVPPGNFKYAIFDFTHNPPMFKDYKELDEAFVMYTLLKSQMMK
jgi:hypothetical protein